MRFQTKGFTSLLLTLAFVAISFSGVILFLTPRGRMANWTGWTMLGLEKNAWTAIHLNISLLFLIAAALHIFFNWGMLWGYVKKKARLSLNLKIEMLAACVIAGLVLVGTIKAIPPFEKLLAFNEQIKDYWEQKPVTAPVPHAEELSLAELAQTMGLDVDAVTSALRDSGLVVEDSKQKVAEVARQNSRTPSDLYAAIAKRFPETQQSNQEGSGMGFGKGKGSHKGGEGKGGGFGRGKGQGRGMKSDVTSP
jgi:hypothetical protein